MSNPYRDKLLSIGVIGSRTRDRVREWRDESGRHKAVTDELGNTVTQHAKPNSTEDRQDVTVRPKSVRAVINRGRLENADG